MLLTWLHMKAGLHVGSFDLTKKKVIGQKSAQHLLHRTFLLGIFEEFHHAAERKGKIVFCAYKQPHSHMKNDLFLPLPHLTNGQQTLNNKHDSLHDNRGKILLCLLATFI